MRGQRGIVPTRPRRARPGVTSDRSVHATVCKWWSIADLPSTTTGLSTIRAQHASVEDRSVLVSAWDDSYQISTVSVAQPVWHGALLQQVMTGALNRMRFKAASLSLIHRIRNPSTVNCLRK